MTAWTPSISWELAHVGRRVPFLDLLLELSENNVFRHSLYRKPQNAYLYTPRCSRHAPGTFRSILRGEIARINRNSDSHEKVSLETAFFKSKLRLRGYDDESLITRTRRRAPSSSATSHFVVLYSSANNKSAIINALGRHAHLLKGRNVQIVYKHQKSNFLRWYPQWKLLRDGGREEF